MIIGGKEIGYGSRPILSAELGLSHQGDLETALNMIREVAEVGGDGVKLQYFKPDEFIEDKTKTYTYKQIMQDGNKQVNLEIGNYEEKTVSYWQLFKDHEISLDFVQSCKDEADRLGLCFGITCFSLESIEEMLELDIDYFKLASQSIDDIDLLERLNEIDKPIILSYGHVENSHKVKYLVGKENVIHLHCVSEYPAKYPKLWKLNQLSGYFCYGYSDHTIGNDAIIRACELGSIWNELHYTLDKCMSGPDHWYSKDKQELTELVKAI